MQVNVTFRKTSRPSSPNFTDNRVSQSYTAWLVVRRNVHIEAFSLFKQRIDERFVLNSENHLYILNKTAQ